MPINTQLNIEELFALIAEKKSQKNKNSYTSTLLEGGDEIICRKVGEEAVEVVIAAFIDSKKSNKKTKSDLAGEVCDLFYHSLVLLAAHDIELSEIYAEFNRRHKIKNVEQKALERHNKKKKK